MTNCKGVHLIKWVKARVNNMRLEEMLPKSKLVHTWCVAGEVTELRTKSRQRKPFNTVAQLFSHLFSHIPFNGRLLLRRNYFQNWLVEG